MPLLVAPPDTTPVAEALRTGLLGRLLGVDNFGTADTLVLLPHRVGDLALSSRFSGTVRFGMQS